MGQDFRIWLFLGVAFLLGCINVLYNSTFYVFFAFSFLLNVSTEPRIFWENIKRRWKYLLLPIGGCLYIIIHYLISLCLSGIPYKASWGSIETFLMYFFVIPVYVVSVKSFINSRLLKHFLLTLCWGVLVFNFTKFFYITKSNFFTEPIQTIQNIYSGRFGSNMELLGGFVLLEAQALYLSVTSVISYFFILQTFRFRQWKGTFWNSIVIFVLSLLFLSFTVTRGATLAFGCSFLFLSFVYFLYLSSFWRVIWGGALIILIAGIYWGMPQTLKDRLSEASVEIENVPVESDKVETTAKRIALWKEDFAHFGEWGIWGLGVYKKFATREWYQNSRYEFIRDLTNTHNSFLDFWLLGGISGLLFICYYFGAPVLKMFRQKKYSFLIIAILLTLVITNNVCLLITLVDAAPLMIFIFAMAFLWLEHFYNLEQIPDNFLKNQK